MTARKRANSNLASPTAQILANTISMDVSIESTTTSKITCTSEFSSLSRRKYIDLGAVETTTLKRCLNTVDLTFLGDYDNIFV